MTIDVDLLMAVGAQLIVVGGFFVRMESRLTRIETQVQEMRHYYRRRSDYRSEDE